MSIDQADPRLTAYVFGELSDEEREALEAELSSDEAASERLAEIQRAVGALRAEFSEPKPHKLEAERRQTIEAAVGLARQKRRRRLLWGTVSVAGIAAAVLLLATGLASQRKPALLAVAPSVASPDVEATNVVPLAPPAPTEVAMNGYDHGVMAAESVPAAPATASSRPLRPNAARGLPGIASYGDGLGVEAKPRQSKPAVEALPAAVSSVNAGEWDDNANYREFMRWLATEPAPGAHRIDVRDRRFLVVRDAAGLGVPSCRVVIADENDRQTELWTTATGRAILFPHAEGLAGRTLTATTDCAGGASRSFFLSGADGLDERGNRSREGHYPKGGERSARQQRAHPHRLGRVQRPR